MPEVKVGSYTYASTQENLTKITGLMQILHSAFLAEWAKILEEKKAA
jgi:hypothetical protein